MLKEFRGDRSIRGRNGKRKSRRTAGNMQGGELAPIEESMESFYRRTPRKGTPSTSSASVVPGRIGFLVRDRDRDPSWALALSSS